MASRVRAALGITQDMPAAWVFSHQTIRLLADQVSRRLLAEESEQQAQLLPSVSGQLPAPGAALDLPTELSFQQEMFLLLWQQDPSTTVYNFPWGVHLSGKVDAAALQTAVYQLAERHLVRPLPLRVLVCIMPMTVCQCAFHSNGRLPFCFDLYFHTDDRRCCGPAITPPKMVAQRRRPSCRPPPSLWMCLRLPMQHCNVQQVVHCSWSRHLTCSSNGSRPAASPSTCSRALSSASRCACRLLHLPLHSQGPMHRSA